MVLVLAILVAIVWLLRLRRRARLVPINEHMVVCGIGGGHGGRTLRGLRNPAHPSATRSRSHRPALLALLALGLRPARWRMHPHRATANARMASAATDVAANPDGQHRSVPGVAAPRLGRTLRTRSQFVLGCVGLALFAVGASAAVAAARTEWVPPPELSIRRAGAGRGASRERGSRHGSSDLGPPGGSRGRPSPLVRRTLIKERARRTSPFPLTCFTPDHACCSSLAGGRSDLSTVDRLGRTRRAR